MNDNKFILPFTCAVYTNEISTQTTCKLFSKTVPRLGRFQ